jgi:hypothetical protein
MSRLAMYWLFLSTRLAIRCLFHAMSHATSRLATYWPFLSIRLEILPCGHG